MSYFNPSTSSGRKTADAVISALPSLVKSVILEGDGTNAATIAIYDNATTNTGVILATVLLKAGDKYAAWSSASGVEGLNGVYADVTGTGAAYVVHYSVK